MTDKPALRRKLRRIRTLHEGRIPVSMRSLLFHRPPTPLLDLIPAEAVIGLYHPVGSEASPLAYARWFHEQGHRVALPWFAARGAPMQFREWVSPYNDDSLVPAPYAGLQPADAAAPLTIDVAIVPLLGFTQDGQRIGQGAGHYDRYLAEHRHVVPIGLAWDCQLVDQLPLEPHDRAMTAVVTPTRMYGPF